VGIVAYFVNTLVEKAKFIWEILMEDITKIEKEYTKDWERKENANVNTSFGAFIGFILNKILKKPEVISKYFPPEAVKMHFNGDIHIHKLPFSLWIPYCAGWSYSKILMQGLVTPTMTSRPAKHFDSAVSHLINFFFLAAQEWTGAQAISAFDLHVAPFVRYDNLSYKEVKQGLQKMLFELNYPSRMGYQSPFTNITLVLDTVKDMLNMPAIVGGKYVGTFGDYIDEALLVNKALLELYLEGDAKGKPFTFPIITLMVTKSFDWNGSKWGELSDLIFSLAALRGSIYFLNGYATNVEALYAMCCRLTIDISKLAAHVANGGSISPGLRGLWAIPDATGSIGVITINLPRIAYLSGGSYEKLEDLLLKRLEIARKVLKVMRKRYYKSLEQGLMPITRRYLGTFANHYSTIGVIGLPEAAANFMGTMDLWNSIEKAQSALMFMKRVLRFIKKVCAEFEEEDGIFYNVEEVPGESTAYRLAMLDRKMFGDKMMIPEFNGIPFYSNSIVPYYVDVPIQLRAMWEGEVQEEFTGGVIMHLFLHEPPDPIALKKFVRNILERTKLVYLSITPTISVCSRCGYWQVGILSKCPKCDSPRIEIWSRVVGYYRPIHTYNVGRRAEFMTRVHYGGGFTIKPSDIIEWSAD